MLEGDPTFWRMFPRKRRFLERKRHGVAVALEAAEKARAELEACERAWEAKEDEGATARKAEEDAWHAAARNSASERAHARHASANASAVRAASAVATAALRVAEKIEGLEALVSDEDSAQDFDQGGGGEEDSGSDDGGSHHNHQEKKGRGRASTTSRGRREADKSYRPSGGKSGAKEEDFAVALQQALEAAQVASTSARSAVEARLESLRCAHGDAAGAAGAGTAAQEEQWQAKLSQRLLLPRPGARLGREGVSSSVVKDIADAVKEAAEGVREFQRRAKKQHLQAAAPSRGPAHDEQLVA